MIELILCLPALTYGWLWWIASDRRLAKQVEI